MLSKFIISVIKFSEEGIDISFIKLFIYLPELVV
jgi:hypothetical protein